ncbi:MAG: AAA family ATPase [Candidatus Aenigmatarchaeota archaeon]|nr:MAG: AAA family ATPase [Candidatus Aenigmarchaeota archaeon]
MERVKTGIPGLDEIMMGGVPRSHQTLITGTSGTGKTMFCCQYMYNGVKKYNDRGVYLSFEEPADSITENAKSFGWDFKSIEKSGKFSFIRYDPYHIEDVFDILESTIRQVKANRVVVDSISALGLHIKDEAELRRMIFNLSIILRKLGCTSLLVSEIVPGTKGLSRYGVEEFVADSVVVLYYERLQSTFVRAVQIWKIRGSPHSEKLHPYKIDNSGVTVYPKEEAFIKRT